MLILSRRLDESIVIDNGRIVVTVVEIRGDRVRLGVIAERAIPVHRGEIQDKIDRNEPRRKGA